MSDAPTFDTPIGILFAEAPRIREERIEYMRVVVAFSPSVIRRVAAMRELERLGAVTLVWRH